MITRRDLEEYVERLHKKLSNLVDRVQAHERFHDSSWTMDVDFRARRLESLLSEHKHSRDAHGMDDFKLLLECLGLEIKDTPARREVVKKDNTVREKNDS